jgi:hypothetical protein
MVSFRQHEVLLLPSPQVMHSPADTQCSLPVALHFVSSEVKVPASDSVDLAHDASHISVLLSMDGASLFDRVELLERPASC